MFERKCRREPVPSRDESRRRICRFIGTIENGREDGNETFPVSSSHARDSFFFFLRFLSNRVGSRVTIMEFRIEFLE